MSVLHLTKESLPRALAVPGKKVLLDFRADWCGPCQMLTPVLEKLSESHPDVLVASVDVGEMPEAAAQFRVSSIPALFLLQEVLSRLSSATTRREDLLVNRNYLEKVLWKELLHRNQLIMA